MKGVEESSQKTVLESRETVRRFRRRTEKTTDKSYHKNDSPSKKILDYNWCFSQFHQEHSPIIRCVPRLRSERHSGSKVAYWNENVQECDATE